MKLKYFLLIIANSSLLIGGCATRSTPAPIVNITQAPDYANNEVKNPNPDTNNRTNTTLGSVSEPANTQPQPTNNPTPKNNQPTVAKITSPIAENSTWVAPTSGTIIKPFSPTLKGIDYTGNYGQAVYAINDGKVVYSGNSLKGYGNLVIIKHDKTYLSAYADNKENLVKEGDLVKRGQKIATMGKGTNGKPLLHFEIRQSGKPINPDTLLK